MISFAESELYGAAIIRKEHNDCVLLLAKFLKRIEERADTIVECRDHCDIGATNRILDMRKPVVIFLLHLQGPVWRIVSNISKKGLIFACLATHKIYGSIRNLRGKILVEIVDHARIRPFDNLLVSLTWSNCMSIRLGRRRYKPRRIR